MIGFTLPAAAELQLDPWLLGVAAASTAGLVLLLMRALVHTTRLEVSTGIEGVIGKEGEASSELAPSGTVRVNAEEWTALAEREPIHRGERIEVIGVEGVTLRVKKRPAIGEISIAPRENKHA